MRHIIIGDIHGCIIELKTLIEKIELQSDDKLYFIGDLIDRGPDSVGVVKYARALSEKHSVILILGNHEEKFLRFLDHKEFNESAIKNMKGTEKFDEFIQELDKADLEFLSLSYINYNIPSENICLVHGGIPGNNKIDLSISHKYSHELLKSNKGFELLLKTRFLNESGNFISLGQENEKSVLWAEMYDGRFGTLVFGHHALIGESSVKYKHAINIDTGCVFGGWLSACVIESNSIINFISIKSNHKYYE